MSGSSYDAIALTNRLHLATERSHSRMKTFELSDFSELLLNLYNQALEQPLDGFQDAALDLVRSVVPFDTSIWGTATMAATGVDIHLIHLHRTSEEMLQAYELVKHEDTSARSMMARGTPTNGFHSPTTFARSDVGEFLRRFGHQNFFVSQEINPATRFLHSISLYRADAEAHCTPDEGRLVEALRPHLMQALALNRTRQLERVAPRVPGLRQGFAVADLRGAIYQSDLLFDELMRQEWAGAAAGTLPRPLMDRLLGGNTEFRGRSLVIRRHVEHGLLFLRARARCRADSLTARESEIAQRVAQGQTHKEIARDLSRSPATVRNQIQTIYAKLRVESIAGLIEAIRSVQ
jgi:DNA-binding CsgD family transcriptional regulator